MRIPRYIDQHITVATLAAIEKGGCASGAYMPAVTYAEALDIMARHGDTVLDDIEDVFGTDENAPRPPAQASWSGMACFYLSLAVELWACTTLHEIIDRHDTDEWDEYEPWEDGRAVADI